MKLGYGRQIVVTLPPVVDQKDWAGLVNGRSDEGPGLSVVLTSAPAGGSWSGPFRATASDGQDWFVKALDTCPAGQETSVAAEFLTAGAGRLIGAPVCKTSLIRITSDIAGWSPRPGSVLTEGWAHASLALEHADERGRPALDARNQDDNARRHVGVYALFDWCFGSDQQWLYDIDHDRTIYSHDHGFYFPPLQNGYWTAAEAVASVDKPNTLPDPPSGLDGSAIETFADALEAVTRDSLAGVMNAVPVSWPVSDEDLETLGWFLETRAPAVASRLRMMK